MWYLFQETDDGLPEQWFLSAVVVRDFAVLALCALVIWQIYHPTDDLVRRGTGWQSLAVDDPGGGVLDRAPDRLPWPRRSKVRTRPAPEDPTTDSMAVSSRT